MHRQNVRWKQVLQPYIGSHIIPDQLPRSILQLPPPNPHPPTPGQDSIIPPKQKQH